MKRIVPYISIMLLVVMTIFAAERSDEKKFNTKKARLAMEKLATGNEKQIKDAAAVLAGLGPKSAELLDNEIRKREKELYPYLYAAGMVRKKWGLGSPLEPERKIFVEPPEPGEYLRGKFDEAKRLFKGTQYKRARNMASALLTLEPELTFRRDVVFLLHRCSERLMQKNTLNVSIELEKTVYETGDVVEFKLRIANLSDNKIEIITGEGSVFGKLTCTEEAYIPGGDYYIDRKPLSVELKGDITLPPGKAWEKKVLMHTKHLRKPKTAFRTFTVNGRIRPRDIKVNGTSSGRLLYVNKASFDVLPKGYVSLAVKTKTKLKEAVKDLAAGAGGDGRLRLFLCTFLLDEYFYKEAAGMLFSILKLTRNHDQRTVMVCLKRVTGKDISFDVGSWEIWHLKEYGKPIPK